MALINTLRNKAGKVVVIALTITMASFVLTDLFSNSSLLTGQDREIAEIDGNEITYEDFQAKINELSYIHSINTGRNPQGDEMDRIKDQAWQALLVRMAYEPQYRALGMSVSQAENVDMVQGDNTHPHVAQMLGNPQTGQFDKSTVPQILQQINQGSEQQRDSWIHFESTLGPSRQMTQLDILLDKTNYVTTSEGKSQHITQNSFGTIEYVYVPFSSIADSTVSVSNEELQNYLKKNEEQYQRDESRDMSYITFSIAPSAEDTAIVIQEMDEVVEGLRNSDDDSLFASINSDGGFPFMTYRRESIPDALLNEGTLIAEGSLTDVVTLDDRMIVYKMTGSSEGSESYVKASHILVKWTDDSDAAKATAKSKANDVLRKARGGDFASLASEFSEDQSNAQRGGDLGWFGENSSFVQPFKDAAFGHKGRGLIPRVIETEFGFHIIKIDEPKDNTQYKVAVVEKEFFVSNQTLEGAYREASLFQVSVENADEFISKAEEAGYDVQSQSRVNSTAQRIGGLVNARSIVLWLFNEASESSVSDVFELDNQYVLAAMTGIQEKGLARAEDVENEVTLKIRNTKKASTIISTLAGIGNQTFEEIVGSYGDGATTGEVTITLSSNSITGVGSAPEAVGVAFSLEEGEATDAFETSNGVILMKLISKNMAEEQEDYTTYLQQLLNQRASRKMVVTDFPLTYFRTLVSEDLDNAIKELSGLEDKRYKFF